MLRRNDLENVTAAAMSRRRALKLFAATGTAGALAPALAACTSASSSPARMQQALRVGLIYPQAGPLQEVGFEMHYGFQLFLSQNSNQIAGMTVATKTIDEGTTVGAGISAVRSALKSSNYDVLVGIANSEVMAAIPDYVTQARVPVIGSNGSPADLSASSFLWRTSSVAGEASTALAAYLVSTPSGSTQAELPRPHSIVVYNDGTPDAITEAKAFVTGIGGSSINIHQVQGSVSSSNVYSQIRSWSPGLVYAATSVTNGNAFIMAYRRAGISKPLCGPGALTERSSGLAGAHQVFTAMNYSPDLNNQANAAFTSAYFAQSNGKLPTAYAMATYDAASVLDVTISNITSDVTPTAINTALSGNQSFDSPRGRWQFNQSRTPLQQWYLRQVRLDGAAWDNRALADLEALT